MPIRGAYNLGATRGYGSSSRMFNYCRQTSTQPWNCINQFITIQPTPTPTPTPTPDTTILRYNTTQGSSFNWGTSPSLVTFTLEPNPPEFSYKANTTFIPSTPVPSPTQLIGVTIGDIVTSGSPDAFQDCTNLVSVIIPNSVTSIGENMFQGCTNLTSIIIPDSVTSIGDNAFFSSGLTTVSISSATASVLGISGSPISFFGANDVVITYTS